jgi:hypothetical protein
VKSNFPGKVQIINLSQVLLRFLELPLLARLRNAANVKHLDLTGAVFLGNAGLKHLAALSGLESLKLDAARMTDAGLEHLHKLRNLKKLYLFESGSSPAGIEKLKKAIPGVQVFE